MKAKYEDNGTGQLTVGELLDKLRNVPREAKIVSMQASNAQRDGWYWSFIAESDLPVMQPVVFHHHDQPGVRSFGAADRPRMDDPL